MDVKKYALIIAAPLFIASCAGLTQEAAKPIDAEDARIVDLKNALAATNLRLDELSNKFMLLQEKVANRALPQQEPSSQAAPSAQATPPVESVAADSPPEGLKVVKLDAAHAKLKGQTIKPSGLGPEALYNRGQDLFLAEEYAKARELFAELATKFPAHDLADNALYWTGEAYYSERDYKAALAIFDEAAKKYPSGNKTPDAMLKAAFSLAELGETEKSAAKLSELVRLYPDSPAADRARKRLKNS